MLTREDIAATYEAVLGRIPKDPAQFDRLVAKWATVDALRAHLMATPEYLKRNPGATAAPAATGTKRTVRLGPGPRLITDDTPPQVEYDVPPATLERLIAHVETVWRGFGETEPHWSVLTNSKFKSGSIEQHKDRFFASGERETKAFQAAAARNGVDLSGLRSCLEIGSGVGRVTLWLARMFPEVIGCDISAPHLRLAQEAMEERGIRNVSFRHVASVADYASLPKFDAFFSVISLQHSPPPVQRYVVEQVLSHLNPGGVAFFQIPTQRIDYRFKVEEYLANIDAHERMETHALPQRALFEVFERTGCRVVEMRDDLHSRPSKLSNTFLLRKKGN